MQFIAIVLVAIVATSALLSYVVRHPVDRSLGVSGTQNVVSVREGGLAFREEGMLILDETKGSPGVPFIVYGTERRPIMTKQLIFVGDDCDVYARNLPCTAGAPESPPPFTGGEHIRVEGKQVAERVYVSRITLL